MTKELRFWHVGILAIMVLATGSCDAGSFVDPSAPGGEPAAIEFESLPQAINDGDTAQVSVRITDTNGTPLEGVGVLWATSDSSVAFITDGGQLIGEAPGEVTITASYESLSTSGTLEVRRTPVRLTIASGNGQEAGFGEVLPDSLVVQAQDRRGDPVPAVYVDFVVMSGEGTASPVGMETDMQGYARTEWTVGTTGGEQRLEARARRPAHVRTLQDSVVVFTADLTLGPARVATLEVTPSAASMEVADVLSLTATARDSDGNPIEGLAVTWASSNVGVVTVDGTGLATAQAAGSADITATSDGVVGSARIDVTESSPPPLGSITITPSTDTLMVGETLTLTATARDGNGALITDPEIQWASLDPEIATVDTMGTVIGRSLGTALITASAVCCAADSGTFVVNLAAPGTVQDLAAVSATAESVTLRWSEVDDGSGAPADYMFRFAPAPYEHWGTATPVTEGSCGGVVAGTGIGQVRTCSVDGLAPATTYGFQVVAMRGTTEEAVFGEVSPVITATTEQGDGGAAGTVTITPSSHTFDAIGQELQMSATAHESDGQVIDEPGVTWTSTNTGVATVDADGLVIARGIGTALIIANAACCSPDSSALAVQDQSSPGVVAFFSDWRHSTGGSATAVRDGSKWDVYTNYGGANLLSVVPASGLGFPSGMANALRVEYSGQSAGHVAINEESGRAFQSAHWNAPGTGEGIYFRFYIRQAISDQAGTASGSSHHPVQSAWGTCANQWAWKFDSGPNGDFFVQFQTYTGGYQWYLNTRIAKNHTWRFEWGFYDKNASGQYKLDLRIYNEAGQLAYSAADFRGESTQGGPTGTLAALNPDIAVSDDCIRRFFLGNNGPQWTVGPGEYIYYGGIAVSRDGWVGAYPTDRER
jgi:uncharacterized protein YjdB